MMNSEHEKENALSLKFKKWLNIDSNLLENTFKKITFLTLLLKN